MGGIAQEVRARRLTARGLATQERIVAAAATLMHDRGVAGTSLDDVRAVTGTSKSQLYHYFADKSALVRAVLDSQVACVLATQFPADDPVDSMAALRRWRDRVVALNEQAGFVGGCPLGRLASELADSDPSARQGLAAGFRAWQHRLAEGLGRLRDAGELAADEDVERLALGLLASLQGGLLLAQTARSPTPLTVSLDVALESLALRGRTVVPTRPERGRRSANFPE